MTNDKNLRTTSRGYQLKQGELDIKDPAQWPVKPFTLNAPEATSINIAYNYIRTGIKGTNVGVYNNNYYHTYFGINKISFYDYGALAVNGSSRMAWILGHRDDKTIGWDEWYGGKGTSYNGALPYSDFWENKPNGELIITTNSSTSTNIYIGNNAIGSDIHITGAESKNISKNSNQLTTFWMGQLIYKSGVYRYQGRSLTVARKTAYDNGYATKSWIYVVWNSKYNYENDWWDKNQQTFQNGLNKYWSDFYNAIEKW